MIKVSKILEKSLWEYDLKKIKYSDEILIIRALNFWEISDIKKISKEIWEKKVVEILKTKKMNLDNKSRNFWEIYFKVKQTKYHNQSMYEQLNKPTFTRSFG